MEIELLHFFQPGFFSLLALSLFFLSLLLLIIKRPKLLCNCEICHAYLSSSWSENFHNLCDWYSYLLRKSPTKTIHIHVLGNIITANPENVEYILKTRFENYPKGKSFSTILGDFLGRGIFNVDGDSWKFQKKMAMMELGQELIRSYGFEIVSCEIKDRLVPVLDGKKKKKDGVVLLDLQDVFRRFAFDCICKFSFGIDPMCLDLSLPMSDFAIAFDLASKLSAERAMVVPSFIWKFKRFLNLGSERELKQAINLINILAREVIRKRRKMGFSNHRDLLSQFMKSVSDETYLRDIVVSFLLAGRDTVASALTSFFWVLSAHPDTVSSIRGEAERVLGTDTDITSFEQIKELHYLHAAIYESMRLYPPIQSDSKFCQNEDEFQDGTAVPQGTRVTYHPYAMGRIEEIWGRDCLEFKPERWLRNGVFFSENAFKYPIFQGGFRFCLGKEMAMVELKSVAVSLIQRFNIGLATPCNTSSPRFSPGLTATFSGGLQVLVREREIDGKVAHSNYVNKN